MTGDADKRSSDAAPPPRPASIAPGGDELDQVDSNWEFESTPLKAGAKRYRTSSQRRRALASTVPPPLTPDITTHANVAIGIRDSAGSALELADLHAVRKPSMAARRPTETPMLGTPMAANGRDSLQDLKDKVAMGDFTGALSVAMSILEADPGNAEADRTATHCQGVLIKMYSARLGALHRIPEVQVEPNQIRWLSLDHRAGFLLSLIDGRLSLEQILDISGMARLDALRILHGLFEQQVISLTSAE